MSVNFQNAIPQEMVIRQPVSTSKSILRKNLMELLPEDNSVHSAGSNEIIRFTVSSNSDFLLGPESYFRFRLRRTLPADTTQDTTASATGASLDVGGIHSAIKSFEVRSLSTGTQIFRMDHYNRYYAMKSNIMQSPEEVAYMGSVYGDSLGREKYVDPNNSGAWKAVTITTATVALATSGVLTLGTAGRARSEVQVGDLVSLRLEAAYTTSTYTVGRVTAITSDESITLDPSPEVAIAADKIQSVHVLKRGEHIPARCWSVATRAAAGTAGNDVDRFLEFRPFASILDQNLPLFLMRGGIEILFELDQAHRVLNSGLDVEDVASASMGYQITQPRFMAMMATPHPDIVDQYVQQWKSEAGIIFSIPGVKTRRVTGQTSETNTNLQMHFGVRSGRKIYTVLQDSNIAEADNDIAKSEDSISLALRADISKFQYKVGSHNYPNRPVDAGSNALSVYSTEALEHLRLVSGSKNFRFNPNDWYGVNNIKLSGTVVVPAESRFFVMCADLSRDNGPNSNLTGSDLSVVPVDLELERVSGNSYSDLGYTGTPVYYNFVEHDSFLKLSSQQLSVMN
jgi:hypothetical protein